jgi:hypothetical protein
MRTPTKHLAGLVVISLTASAFQLIGDDRVRAGEEPSSELVADTADNVRTTSDGIVALENGNIVAVPDDIQTPIVIVTSNGDHMSVSLPDIDVGEADTDDGTTAFAGDDTNIVVNPTEDGGLQTLLELEASSAAVRYPFDVTMRPGARLAVAMDGSVSALDVDGSLIGVFSAPWAYDANGTIVPTRFEIEGNQLVQVVDHTAGSYSYPIVADPWWNPFDWDWKKAGRALVSGLKSCLGGAAVTSLGAGAGTVSANVTAKVVAGRLAVQMAGGPWGYFAIGAAGCVGNVIK